MKKITLIIYCFIALNTSAQNIGIGNSNPKAALQISSDTSGLIIPTYSTLTTVNINVLPRLNATDHKGLQVYIDEISNRGFWFYNGIGFEKIGAGGISQLEKITENGKTGYRILGRDAANFGNTGAEAVDFSNQVNINFSRGSTGINSFATGYNTTASGAYSTAMGSVTIASASAATAMGYNTFASGPLSTAIGASTLASGSQSTAIGSSTIASGVTSTAMGSATTASGNYATTMGGGGIASGYAATAMGSNGTASGDYTTAMGWGTFAKSAAEITVGSFNTDYTPISTSLINTADRAFVVGIGADNANRKDGLILFKDGTLALNKLTTTPAVAADRLYVLNNKLTYSGNEIAFAGSTYSQLEKITENNKSGYRIFGRNAANFGNTGAEAIDFSYQPNASTTTGSLGDNSFAAGFSTSASGYASTAIGVRSAATGELSNAQGYETIASGSRSTTMGTGTIAKSWGETVIGSFNTDYTLAPLGAEEFNFADRAFTVGIGENYVNHNDGFIVYKDGTTELDVLNYQPVIKTNKLYNVGNTLYINGAVVGAQTSDVRYKERIENLPSTLSALKKLRPVSFYWKNNKWGSQKEIGFIAQELKEQFPEVVSTDADGFYKVNYGLLTSVLTKGMQEQQAQIEILQKQNQFLVSEIEAIKTALNKNK